jgi:hypothetical protein
MSRDSFAELIMETGSFKKAFILGLINVTARKIGKPSNSR